tara:strand:- start:165 stop:359 length:195 start_codon:yes stop_codon:yes gene_type:complete
MTLQKWLVKKKMSQAEFARLIGASGATVSRYINGSRVGMPQMMRRIVEVTKGQVSLDDLLPKGF